MKEIILSQGFRAVIDDEDFSKVEGWHWYILQTRGLQYAYGWRQINGRQERKLMHRLILSAPRKFDVDHADGNGLNNQRSNLRLATHAQNLHNSKAHSNSSHGLKGVVQDKRRGTWFSKIRIGDGKRLHLGTFKTKEDAYEAYKEAAKKYHGEYAKV